MTDPIDIVNELRGFASSSYIGKPTARELDRAILLIRRSADEIERLRDQVDSMQMANDMLRATHKTDNQYLLDEIERLRGEGDWEYSIGYSCIDLKGNRFWTDDGLGVMDRETAEEEMRTNRDSYLSDDHVVRRRKAGPWERVEGEGDGHDQG